MKIKREFAVYDEFDNGSLVMVGNSHLKDINDSIKNTVYGALNIMRNKPGRKKGERYCII